MLEEERAVLCPSPPLAAVAPSSRRLKTGVSFISTQQQLSRRALQKVTMAPRRDSALLSSKAIMFRQNASRLIWATGLCGSGE